jgi:nicotinamidase-related amidase
MKPERRKSAVVVLLVDVINHMRFPGGAELAANAKPAAGAIAALRRAAHRARVPIVYANDNFGDWSATSADLVRECSKRGDPGASFTRKVRPTRGDCFVLKARNSAFYCTSLEPLLESVGAKTLVLAGLTADNCVLFTAHDAYLRGYRVIVATDAVASQHQGSTERALQQMKTSLKARLLRVSELPLTRG